MYANRIRLDATEEGVGVRMRGRVWALGEDLTLTSAGAVDLGGEVSALRDAVISSETQVRSDGQVNAMRQAELRAPDIVIGRERSGIRAGNISLQATALETGPLTAGSAPTGNIDNHGEIRASGSVSIAARGSVTNRGTIAGRQSIALDAQTLVNHGAIVSEGSATIAAATLRNEVPGGDTRVWEASSPRHTTKVGPAQEQRIPFLRITTQDFEETWRRTQRYAGPTPAHGPLISAGTQLSLNFYKGSNLGGRLHAGTSCRCAAIADTAARTQAATGVAIRRSRPAAMARRRGMARTATLAPSPRQPPRSVTTIWHWSPAPIPPASG